VPRLEDTFAQLMDLANSLSAEQHRLLMKDLAKISWLCLIWSA